MNHNLKLNDDAALDVFRAISDIQKAVVTARELCRVDDAHRRNHAQRFTELLAYLGTIGDAAFRIDAIVFDTNAQTDSEYAVGEGNDPVGVERATTCPVCAGDLTLPLGCTKCDAELNAVLDAEEASYLDSLLTRLDRGIITMREFQMRLSETDIDQTHPCIEPGCEHTVLFDDEPYCYTHSPDEGSSVRGYSYLVYARRAAQAADTVDGFVM